MGDAARYRLHEEYDSAALYGGPSRGGRGGGGGDGGDHRGCSVAADAAATGADCDGAYSYSDRRGRRLRGGGGGKIATLTTTATAPTALSPSAYGSVADSAFKPPPYVGGRRLGDGAAQLLTGPVRPPPALPAFAQAQFVSTVPG
eukprot:SAG22_NODE_697_length_7825_cov_8.757831_10_plen_145_part_00